MTLIQVDTLRIRCYLRKIGAVRGTLQLHLCNLNVVSVQKNYIYHVAQLPPAFGDHCASYLSLLES